MTIYFEEEGKGELVLDAEGLAGQVIEAAADYEGCPYELSVNLLLTDNVGIHRLNKEFRGIDRATDVLSFPMIEYEHAGEFDFLEKEDVYFEPDTGELVLGDIAVSKERVLSQAQEYGHSVKREYAFLIAHSMLHLFGYDHMEKEERAVMEKKQREILENLGISR